MINRPQKLVISQQCAKGQITWIDMLKMEIVIDLFFVVSLHFCILLSLILPFIKNQSTSTYHHLHKIIGCIHTTDVVLPFMEHSRFCATFTYIIIVEIQLIVFPGARIGQNQCVFCDCTTKNPTLIMLN